MKRLLNYIINNDLLYWSIIGALVGIIWWLVDNT